MSKIAFSAETPGVRASSYVYSEYKAGNTVNQIKMAVRTAF